jgi:DNA mismatch repair protein MutS
VKEESGDVVFLHRIVPGGADQSYGIHVARLAGLPASVLGRAREILAFLEKQHRPEAGTTPMPRVKSARALQSSLFAALPEPLIEDLRKVDLGSLTGEAAVELIRRLKELSS